MKNLLIICIMLSIVFDANAQKMYPFKDATKTYIGFKDVKGNIIIEANKYKFSTRYSEYSEGFITCSKEGYWGFLDEKGKEMSEFKYDTPSQFTEGLAFVSYQKKFGYIDKIGNFSIKNIYQNAKSFSEGYAAVKYNGKWGFIDAKGNTKINFLFDDARSYEDGIAALKFNGNWGLFNKSGEIIVSPAYNFIYPFVNDFAIYELFGSFGFFDKNGKKINQNIYNDCNNFKEGYAIVSISSEKGKGLGVIDTSGKEIIEPKLENEKITFKDGIFYVKIEGTKEEKTFNNKGEVIFIVDSVIITETELFNSVMSNSTATIKEPSLQETRDKIFEDLKSNETTVAQNKEETLYYNKYWDICSKSDASFYRIITLDANRKPVGIVRDYYISGKLQFEGEAIFFDKLDDTKTKWKNKVTGYYENGKKQFEENYDNEGNKIGPTKNWDEFGVMDIAIIFRDETLNQLQDSQLNSTKEEFKMYSKDERILEDGKIIRKKSASGDYSYYIVDKNNEVIIYILYSNNYDFQYTASKMIDLSTVRQMERELAEKGFEKVQKKGSASIASNNSDNSVAFEVWTRQDYPYTFYLQTFNCYMKNCQIGMYVNAFFTNP